MGPERVRVVRAGGNEPWRRCLRALCSGALLLLVLLVPAGCSRLSSERGATSSPPLAASGPSGRLQEVAPPLAVQQIQRALEERRPQVSIASPEDGSVLPSGTWTLRISGSDWPLTDAGALGLGAHLAVQVDDGLPLRLTGEATPGERFELAVPMDPLAPGSHRITVTAVRPWGEVVKRPGASAQIRLHRVAANPLTLPAAGTPQLIVTSPAEASSVEPVLLDWLLQDAPLQGLREGDARWRLRVTINGDSFLVDQNTPLWLKGWRQGDNSLLMELVDERGEPINPPFNSLVREVTVGSSGPRPRWLGGALSEQELAALLGEIPAPRPAASTPAASTEEAGEVEPLEAGEASEAQPLTPDTDGDADGDAVSPSGANDLQDPASDPERHEAEGDAAVPQGDASSTPSTQNEAAQRESIEPAPTSRQQAPSFPGQELAGEPE